jgi:hypothetical protein
MEGNVKKQKRNPVAKYLRLNRRQVIGDKRQKARVMAATQDARRA